MNRHTPRRTCFSYIFSSTLKLSRQRGGGMVKQVADINKCYPYAGGRAIDVVLYLPFACISIVRLGTDNQINDHVLAPILQPCLWKFTDSHWRHYPWPVLRSRRVVAPAACAARPTGQPPGAHLVVTGSF
jgi:hypothetical protein